MDALYLFGSVARDDAGPESDIDLAFDVEANRRIGLLEIVEMQLRLEQFVGRHVDLVERSAMRPRVAKSADLHAVRVF